jgi:hypothetical protein
MRLVSTVETRSDKRPAPRGALVGIISGAMMTLVAACGAPPAPQASAPTVTATAPSGSTARPDVSPTPEPGPPEETEHHHGANKNVNVGPSSMLAKVDKLGIDLSKPLSEIPLAKKKKLMPLFQKALGFKDCTGCHAGKPGAIDFKADTHELKLARGMWDHFVVKLRDENNKRIFCDSCHQGEHHLLNRKDKDALNTFMHDDYEHKLARADGEEHSCSTCHTDVFEGHIFRDVWKISDEH